MSSARPTSELESLCAGVGIEVPAGWTGYVDAVSTWGARTDLTAAKSATELCEILFLDAAVLIHAGWSTNALVDVGAGVGAPTIPLLLAKAAWQAVLVEPRRKRVAFLRTTIGATGLASRAEVRENRIGAQTPALAGAPFDTALSRATFDPTVWRDLGTTLAREALVFTAGADLEEDPTLELVRTLRYEVPSTGAPRAIHGFRRRRSIG